MKTEQTKTTEPPACSKPLLCDVPALMKQYFANRDERKKIKIERVEYLTDNKCKIKGKLFYGEKGNQIAVDCLNEISDINKYCDTCKTRHNFYLRLKKIQGANTGIMLKVRSAVWRH